MYKPNKLFLISMVVYCIVVKVLPFALHNAGLDISTEELYPWSFTPIFAFGIFGAAMFSNLRLAFGLPLLAWLIADLLIGVAAFAKYGVAEGMAYAFYPSQLLQYAALILACSTGLLVRYSRKWPIILTATLLSPTLFYLVSNFGVWAFDTWVGYPRDMSGLMQAYIAGIPFYRIQLLSTGLLSAILFSPIGIAQLKAVPSAVTTGRLSPVKVRARSENDHDANQ